MIKKHKICLMLIISFLYLGIFLYATMLFPSQNQHNSSTFSNSTSINNHNINYTEKRASPPYDIIIGDDFLPHYRLFFWVPKTATKFTPYADTGVKTDVSSHGPVGNWSVIETTTTTDSEKLVFIFIPKTFVFLYGRGFEKVIHLKYN